MTSRYLVPFLWVLTLSPYASLAHATLDAVFANFDESNQICLGDGTGQFTCSDVSADTNRSLGVALGDVNDDTFLDAVFANGVGVDQICLGDGTGRFACTGVSSNSSTGVALGDVNSDTFLDAVFANGGQQPNKVCLGDGMGGFTCSDVSIDTNSSVNVALGDVNGDTFLDAVFANLDTNRVCLGDGMGSFACSDVSVDISESGDVALADVNGDTFLDAVFANLLPSGFIGELNPVGELNRVCLGDGMGRFTCSDVSADINLSWGVALGDINGDALLDAVFANGVRQPNKVCLGDGTGRFACSDVSADTNRSLGVALGDVNDDTFLDAVFANWGTSRVCLGDGMGRFTCSDVSVDFNSSEGRRVALGEVGELVMTLIPPSINFGNQIVNTTSAERPVTLSNTGIAPLNIDSIETSGDFDISSENCGSTLVAGANCTINVTFTPTDTGQRTAELTVNSDAASSPDIVDLSGTGTSIALGTSVATPIPTLSEWGMIILSSLLALIAVGMVRLRGIHA